MIEKSGSGVRVSTPAAPQPTPQPPTHRLNHADSAISTPAGEKVARNKKPRAFCSGLFIIQLSTGSTAPIQGTTKPVGEKPAQPDCVSFSSSA